MKTYKISFDLRTRFLIWTSQTTMVNINYSETIIYQTFSFKFRVGRLREFITGTLRLASYATNDKITAKTCFHFSKWSQVSMTLFSNSKRKINSMWNSFQETYPWFQNQCKNNMLNSEQILSFGIKEQRNIFDVMTNRCIFGLN